MSTRTLHLCFDPVGDELLSTDGFALLMGMLLDQQMMLEFAFLGPARLAQRMGTVDHLDIAAIASYDAEEFATLMATPPAVHRYPGTMAGRVQALAQHVIQEYDGDPNALWSDVRSGAALLARLQALPGYGEQKARILVALLGKQCSVTPRGWRASAGDYGLKGSTRSAADVTDRESLLAVRTTKQELKRAAAARANANVNIRS